MRTIRRQLTRKLLLGFALLLSLGGAGVYFSTRTALLEQFDQTLRAQASAISAATERHGKRISLEFTEQSIREFDEGVPVEFFQLRRADGTTIKRSLSLGEANLPAVFGSFERPRIWNLKLPSGFHGRAIGYAFSPRTSREAEAVPPEQLTLTFGSDRRELDETLSILALVLIGCGALLLGGTMLIVPRVLREELAPLDHLAEQAAGIHAHSLSTRFPSDSVPGELKPISDRLNDLLGRLEESFTRERRFSADVAHELRTPIAELRSAAEIALKWPETRPTETDRDTLAIALQMEGIVVRLLELLRSEDGQLTPARVEILLGPFVENLWQTFAGRANAKQLQVTKDIPADARILSDPVLLRSILANLLDNAVAYTPHAGTIRIHSALGDARFTVSVANTAEQIKPSDLPRFFERFWRKDRARSGTNHSGLGLALARNLAQSLGCELTASLNGESLLILTLSGPAASTG